MMNSKYEVLVFYRYFLADKRKLLDRDPMDPSYGADLGEFLDEPMVFIRDDKTSDCEVRTLGVSDVMAERIYMAATCIKSIGYDTVEADDRFWVRDFRKGGRIEDWS